LDLFLKFSKKPLDKSLSTEYNTHMKNKQYQVQSLHNVILSREPLGVGYLVYFQGTKEECKAHKINWKRFPDTAYKGRSTMIREVSSITAWQIPLHRV